jgi:ribosomal protein S18 acetylase RimI-like enzyme
MTKTVGIMKVAAAQDSDLDDSFYELHYIYLHPDYFRMGIGIKAMAFAFDKARSLEKKTMVVWVLERNENAIKLYEKCGFAADGKTMTQNRGKPLALIRMRKELGLFYDEYK